jgi:hypothetical protein
MQIDVWNGGLEKLRHLRPGEPGRLAVQPHLQARLRAFRLEQDDFAAGFGFLWHNH